MALWRSGSLPWKPHLAPAAAALKDAADAVAPEDLAAAVEHAARARLGHFLAGVQSYRGHSYRRAEATWPVLWQEGSARLLDYGADLPRGAPALLLVPSLINRAYILDLAPDRSLIRHLRDQGVRCLLLDWGSPGRDELAFTLTDYVAGPLDAALDAAVAAVRAPVGLAGYCMGGLLALGAALRRPGLIRHLALIATPWDFHADRSLARRVAAMSPGVAATLNLLGHLPIDLVQMLIYALDPLLVVRKFTGLGEAGAEPGQGFVALEDWLNDGVPLAGPVARECLLGWYAANTPARRAWRLAGRPVDPARLAMPVLAVIPARDRIVPPDSALALAQAIRGVELLRPRFGHVAMMATPQAAATVWQPLADWCRTRG